MSEELKIWFGKNSGKPLSEVPSDYLLWIVENMDPEPLPGEVKGRSVEYRKFVREQKRDLISAAEDELLNREQA